MGLNPFKAKAARKIIDESGVKVGDYVKVSWNYDKAYGVGTSWHEGTLARLDDWIEVRDSPKSPGHLYLPITSIATIEGLSIEAVPRPEQKENPFIKKARRVPGREAND